jgi:calcium/calmodulin-dependent protein kinase I
MSSDIEHWHINAKVYDDRVEEIHLISDPARNIRRKQYTTVWHIERYLGRGSCGEVRLERNRNEDKVRAVKRVTTSSSTLSQKECEQELKALLEFSKPKARSVDEILLCYASLTFYSQKMLPFSWNFLGGSIVALTYIW